VTTKAHNVRVNSQRQDMNLVKLIDRFGSEDRCRDYLKALRWPEGVRCVKCGSASVSWISTRKQFDCNSCRRRFSVTAGTVFHDSHLPLWKWFLATYMMVESKKGISANQLKRTLAVSYKTAWYLCHRVRWAMHETLVGMLRGVVEADETYIGGKRKGRGHMEGWRNKTVVLGAVERGGQVRLRVDRRGHSQTTAKAVEAFLRDVVADDAEAIFTDQSSLYARIGDQDTRHESVDHGKMEWIRGDVSTQGIESAWSLLKRSIVGSYHQLSAKHLPAYLDEFAFRFNNRENPFLFRDTLLKLLSADALRYAELTAP
jgi:transposase-like protein